MENQIKRRLSPFGQFMTYGKAGDFYYSDKSPKDITSIAFTHKGRKVRTEKVLCTSDYKTDTPATSILIKVTILE
jgi:hypothetical protein